MALYTKYTNLFRNKDAVEDDSDDSKESTIRPTESNSEDNKPGLFKKFKGLFEETPGQSKAVSVPDLVTGKAEERVVQAENEPSKFRKFANYAVPSLFGLAGGLGILPGLAIGALGNDASKRRRSEHFDENVKSAEDVARQNYNARTGRIAATRPREKEELAEKLTDIYSSLPGTSRPVGGVGPTIPQQEVKRRALFDAYDLGDRQTEAKIPRPNDLLDLQYLAREGGESPVTQNYIEQFGDKYGMRDALTQKIRVRKKATGEEGEIPAVEFDPRRYERL